MVDRCPCCALLGVDLRGESGWVGGFDVAADVVGRCTVPFTAGGGGSGLLGEDCGDGRLGGGGFVGIALFGYCWFECLAGGGGAGLLPLFACTCEDIAARPSLFCLLSADFIVVVR